MNDIAVSEAAVFSGTEMIPAPEVTMSPTAATPGSVALAAEQSRAIAEIQAALVVAQARPRNESAAVLRIKKQCRRPSLAQKAEYSFDKGNGEIRGATIRLMEVIAREWGNIRCGIRELSRGPGYSEMQAYAWDLQSNFEITREFRVNHIRDTSYGPQKLKSERDKYEITANMGQRRIRSCLEGLIPGDIIEAAVNECRKTLTGQNSQPIEDRVREMVDRFDALGVNHQHLEQLLGHGLDTIVPREIERLIKVHNAIRDGESAREDFFEIGNGKRSDANGEGASRDNK